MIGTEPVFECTWEELAQQGDYLAGKRLRVVVLENGNPATQPQAGSRVAEGSESPRNLAELLGDYIGSVTGTEEPLSERTGERFTGYLEQKRREGRL